MNTGDQLEPVAIALPRAGPAESRRGKLPRTTMVTAALASILFLVVLADGWFITHPTRLMQGIGNERVSGQRLAGISRYVLGYEYPRHGDRAACPVAVQGTRHDGSTFTVYAVAHCVVPQPDCRDASDGSVGVVARFNGPTLIGAKVDDAIDYDGGLRAIKIFPSSIRDGVNQLLDVGGPTALRQRALELAGCNRAG